MTVAFETDARLMSDSLIAADRAVHERQAHLFVLLVELAQRVGERFERTLHVGLEHEVERGDLAALDHREDVLEAGAAGQAHRVLQVGGATPVGAGLGHRAGRLLVGCGAQLVAGERDVVEPEHLDRRRRAGLLHLLAVLVEHGPDLAPRATGDDRVADAQRAALDERGDDRAAALVEVRLEHQRAGRHLRVGRELLDLGDQQDRLEQLVDPDPGGRRDVDDDHVAAPRLGHELALDQLLAHAGRVGVVAVDLGDRHDDRHLGRTRVVDRLDGLRHHAVVGRDHQDGDVGRVGAAGPHGGERLVARRVDERDRVPVVHGLVGTDVLGDATRLTGDDVRVPDVVEQRGLAVVDVAEHGHDRRTRLEVGVVFVVVVTEQGLQLELGLLAGLDQQDLGAERLGDELDHLVGQRLRAGDHLTRVEEQADEVGGRAVQLGRELLDGAAALDDDLALGYGRVGRRELRHRRGTEILEVATTTLLAPGPLTLRAGSTASAGTATGATGSARTTPTTAGTAGATTGTLETAPATTGSAAAGTLEATAATAPSGTLEATATTNTTRTAGAARAAGATAAGHDPRAGRRRDAPTAAGRRRDRATGHAARWCRRRFRRCRRSRSRSRGRGRGSFGGGRCRALGRSRSGRGRSRGNRCRGRGRRGRSRGRTGRRRRGRRAGIQDDAGRADHAMRRGRGRDLGVVVGDRHLDQRGRGHRSGRGVATRLLDGRLGLGLGGPALRLRLGLGLGLVDDRVATKPLGVGHPADAVRGGVVDARRVALDADLQALGEIEHHLVLDAELSRQLVDPDLLRSQARCLCFLYCVLHTSPVSPLARTLPSTSLARSCSMSSSRIGMRNARSTARRRRASSRHAPGWARQSQAPRPGPGPSASPDGARRKRTSSSTAATRRHPMQVRRGRAARVLAVSPLRRFGGHRRSVPRRLPPRSRVRRLRRIRRGASAAGASPLTASAGAAASPSAVSPRNGRRRVPRTRPPQPRSPRHPRPAARRAHRCRW